MNYEGYLRPRVLLCQSHHDFIVKKLVIGSITSGAAPARTKSKEFCVGA